MAKEKKTICIDFDGVLADYSEGYQGKDKFGELIPGADLGTQVLKEKGWTIIIYTTRPATAALKKWLEKNNVKYDYINENPDQPEDSKAGCKIAADIYLDDRGITFQGQWSEWLLREIAEFQPCSAKKTDQKKEMEKAYDDGKNWLKKTRAVLACDSSC